MAYVLINSDLGAEDEVLERLRELPEVKECYLVYGVYDIIVRVETETKQELEDTVRDKIRNMGHVRSTLTMMVV